MLRLLWGLVSALILLRPLPLWAAQEPGHAIAFLGLRTLGTKVEQAVSFDLAVRETLIQHTAFSLIPHVVSGGTCDGAQACFCTLGNELKARAIVFGNVGRFDPTYTFELFLVEPQTCRKINRAFATEQLSEPEVPKRLEELTVELVQPFAMSLTKPVVQTKPVEPARTDGQWPVGPIALWTIGAAGLTVATVFGAQAYTHYRDVQDENRVGRMKSAAEGRDAQTVAFISLASGLLAAGGGFGWWWLE